MSLQLIYNFPQFALHLFGQISQALIIDGLHGCNRVHRGDFNFSLRGFLNDYVTRQRYPDLIFGSQSLVGQGRAARAQDVGLARFHGVG
jgi:hypothetical protein